MSAVMKRRIRVYAFTSGLVVAIMAGIPPLDTVGWPKVVIVVLGLIVGIMNIRGDDQMSRFLIAAIGLKVTSTAFLGFSGVADSWKAVIINLEIFITSGLLYVALVLLYGAIKDKARSYKVWFYIAAVVLVLTIWLLGDIGEAVWVAPASVLLLLLGLVVGYFEGPKSPSDGVAQLGTKFLMAAVGFQLSANAVYTIVEEEFEQYRLLVVNSKVLLENATIFTTSALLAIAFMAIFWVLDEITD